MTAAYLLLSVGAFVILSTFAVRQAGAYMLEARQRECLARDTEIAYTLDPWRGREDLWETLYSSLADKSDRLMLVDEAGVVQADTESLLDGSRLARAEVASALEGAEACGWYAGGQQRTSYWTKIIMGRRPGLGILSAVPLPGGGALVYVSPADSLYGSLFWFRLQAGLLAAGILVLLCMGCTFVMRRFTRPVEVLNEGIARITRGDMQTRVTVKGKNEFAQLATAFNMMCEQLESLENTRNRFVSDASHELKTPLSTMKILIETLLYQDPMDEAMTKEFLGDVNKEIDRLSTIIGDLLTLVHMDSGERAVKMTEVPLSQVLSDVIGRLLPLSRERGIEMNCMIRDQVTLQGNAMKLSQVFYNLIDNAIKYTPRGGIVHMELGKSGKTALFRITDSGIGIPKDDLPRVFDRFYRVDKTRSRETGGTGLGLSIVKQIVQMHGGVISVTSEEGKGSTFRVELPIV